MRFLKHAKVVGLFCAMLPASSVWAGPYLFTTIADSAGGYSGFSTPTVNGIGTVAFLATTGGTGKIFTGKGGAVTTALDPATAGLSNPIDAPSINDAGKIAFIATGPASNPPGGNGVNVYRLDAGGTPIRVYDANANSGESYHAAMGADDNVYFSAKTLFNAQLFGRGNGIFVAPLFKVQIATSGFNRPAVAPNGTSAATLHGGLLGPADYLVLDSSPLPLGVIPANVTNIGDCDVNSNGDLVFTVLINSQVNALYLYKSKMFSFTNIATGRAIPAINDRGTVAALFTEGTEYLAVGLGKPSDTILSVGDAFMGSTVTELDFQSGGLSESNQLAFYAALADGRSGIYVTTVPEPAALGMVAGMAMLLRRRRLAQC